MERQIFSAMNVKTLTHRSQLHCFFVQNPSIKFNRRFISPKTTLRIFTLTDKQISISSCMSSNHEIVSEPTEDEKEEEIALLENQLSGEISENKIEAGDLLENESLWSQMIEILKFSGPAVGLWISGPLMSLIDTAVVGQGSSLELAALGPGTVFCDYASYMFMFLSIATSNLVATSLARQIRGIAWPAILIGWVAQSASLGMKDSWGPLKALAVASAINGIGDIALCRFLGFGIAGAAWATMVSQVVAAYMMIEALNKKGYDGFAISIPSLDEFLQIFKLAAPAFLTIMSKVVFYALLVYFATSMGTKTVAAHQVMIQLYCICAVWGEPLSQTAQSFMPELMYGSNRSLTKVRTLLKSLVIIGALSGLALGSIGTSLPWLFPKIFSSDPGVIHEMHKVLIPYFIALCLAPPINCFEGTLMAGRELKFMSISMSGIACLGALLLLTLSRNGYGLIGCWFGLVAFQCSLFAVLLRRLTLPDGILYSEDSTHYQLEKLKTS
ncbi:hypothetical protein RD792_002171 [Penstemon davidsonii]|uniref:Protein DETOXIFICATION n=1 Tax=Penstemon davidsonii TaxID=160366 RepID=A0ABR0DRI9_9LAMI|nr:hypothetical protein RD792_002171 [Penstemon davidsonii]